MGSDASRLQVQAHGHGDGSSTYKDRTKLLKAVNDSKMTNAHRKDHREDDDAAEADSE